MTGPIRLTDRRGKYNNRRTEVDGLTFDSAAESRRYRELTLMQAAGKISDLSVQPKYDCVVNGVKVCSYLGDFRYTDCETGKVICEDCKGVKTAVYNLKKRLMVACHGIAIREVQA